MTERSKVTVEIYPDVLRDFAPLRWDDISDCLRWGGNGAHGTEVVEVAAEVLRSVWNTLNPTSLELRAGEVAKALTEGSATASSDTCVVVRKDAMELAMRFLKDVSES
jgi:hypothetical protein|tara:strand:+ start:1253 stop:1576 length:324 start_codon:yes stop_codon:yes gene_type:complete